MSDKHRRLRAAIYVRCAASVPREDPLTDQIERCRELVSAEGLELVDIYKDVNRGGMKHADRSGLWAMLAALEQRAFDHLVIDDLSRLSRDVASLLGLLQDITAAGVVVHCVSGSCELGRALRPMPKTKRLAKTPEWAASDISRIRQLFEEVAFGRVGAGKGES